MLKRIVIATGSVLTLSRPAIAAAAEPQSHLLQLAGGLLLVIGLILLLSWLLRRLQGGRLGLQGPVRVLGGTAVGQRERVVLVQIGEQQLLLGVAPGSVRTLQVFDQPVIAESSAADGHGQRQQS